MPNNILCNAHYLWDGLTVEIRRYFSSMSLEDIISGNFKERIYDKLVASLEGNL
jgi:Rrf2 family iron-sulfur cluster assembly transcriptional regulator